MVNFMFCEFFLNKSKVDTVDQVEEVKVVREPLSWWEGMGKSGDSSESPVIRWAVSVGAPRCATTRPRLPGFADPTGLCTWKGNESWVRDGAELECSGAWPLESSPKSKGASSA